MNVCVAKSVTMTTTAVVAAAATTTTTTTTTRAETTTKSLTFASKTATNSKYAQSLRGYAVVARAKLRK